MGFEAWSSSLSNLVQAAAILIGGGWAYMKFVRGRTFRYRARLDAVVEPFAYGGDPVFRLEATMRNEGLSKIDLSLQDEKQVVVHAALQGQWLPDVNIAWDDENSEVIRTPLFQRHTWIESGETIEDALFIPLGGLKEAVIAYRVRAIVKAPRGGLVDWVLRRFASGRRRKLQVWTADLVVPGALQPTGLEDGGEPTRDSPTTKEKAQ